MYVFVPILYSRVSRRQGLTRAYKLFNMLCSYYVHTFAYTKCSKCIEKTKWRSAPSNILSVSVSKFQQIKVSDCVNNFMANVNVS